MKILYTGGPATQTYGHIIFEDGKVTEVDDDLGRELIKNPYVKFTEVKQTTKPLAYKEE